MNRKLLLLLLFIAILAANAGSARAELNYGSYLQLNCDSLGDCLKTIISFVSTKVVPPIAVIFLMLAGFKFVTSQGNEAKLTEAKSMITWTIIGIAIAIGALALAYAFSNFITGIS